jgi:5'-methylthioadenosine phosphorylase
MKVAIIGGTGLYDPDLFHDARDVYVKTPYGQVKAKEGVFADKPVVFLSRHGEGATVPPHKINYRGNIYALKELGVDRIIATAAVGSLNEDVGPGNVIMVDQFLDFTKGRESTFCDGGEEGVRHVDMTEPYCPELREVLTREALSLGLNARNGGCYVCTEGPRYETPAEIRMFQMLKGDVIGMTGVPEVVLARELGLCYSSISTVSNLAAGLSKTELSHQEVVETMAEIYDGVKKLLENTVRVLSTVKTCGCQGR